MVDLTYKDAGGVFDGIWVNAIPLTLTYFSNHKLFHPFHLIIVLYLDTHIKNLINFVNFC